MLAGYPKVGKTELLCRIVEGWAPERVLFVTEEPEGVWAARLKRRPSVWGHVTLVFGLGTEPSALLNRVEAGVEEIVIVDTIRSLLGLEDENDNSGIARTLAPWVAGARRGGKTLILGHHERKQAGEHGQAIAGAHAFLGVVDIALELNRDPHNPRRRILRGWGRVYEVPELLLEMDEAGELHVLGEPGQVALEAVKERVRETSTGEWTPTKEVLDSLGEPKPSLEQVRKALGSLAGDGQMERQPPMGQDKSGATYRWRAATSPPTVPPLGWEVGSSQLPEGVPAGIQDEGPGEV